MLRSLYAGRRQLFWARGSKIFSSLPLPLLLPPSLPRPFSHPLRSLFFHSLSPNPARGLGERCKLPQRVRAEPGHQTGFGAFWTKNNASCDIKLEEFFYGKMLLCNWIPMSSLPVRPFPLPNPAEGRGSAVSLLAHFRLKRIPLVILFWSTRTKRYTSFIHHALLNFQWNLVTLSHPL